MLSTEHALFLVQAVGGAADRDLDDMPDSSFSSDDDDDDDDIGQRAVGAGVVGVAPHSGDDSEGDQSAGPAASGDDDDDADVGQRDTGPSDETILEHKRTFFALTQLLSMLQWNIPSRSVAVQLNVAAITNPSMWLRANTSKDRATAALAEAAGVDIENLFRTDVRCDKCSSTYAMSDLIDFHGTGTERTYSAYRCEHIPFPSNGEICGEHLVRFKPNNRSESNARPLYSIPIVSIEDALRRILSRPAIKAVFHHWKKRPPTDGLYTDVYDGAIWKEFLSYEGEPFLNATGIALQLNLDWFSPMKNTPLSEGAVYLSIMNLPRSIRFLKENMILVSAFSTKDGKEMTCDVGQLLDGIVGQLVDLWEYPLGGITARWSSCVWPATCPLHASWAGPKITEPCVAVPAATASSNRSSVRVQKLRSVTTAARTFSRRVSHGV
jgi:hypothetical protein